MLLSVEVTRSNLSWKSCRWRGAAERGGPPGGVAAQGEVRGFGLDAGRRQENWLHAGCILKAELTRQAVGRVRGVGEKGESRRGLSLWPGQTGGRSAPHGQGLRWCRRGCGELKEELCWHRRL